MNLLLTRKINKEFNNPSIPKFSKVLSKILMISLPAAAETLFMGIIGLMDTIMVGSRGKEALAAVSICQQPVFITLAAAFGMSAGITAVVSRRKGENDPDDARKTIRQSILISIVVGEIITLLSVLFARPFLIVTGAEDDTIDLAVSYFTIVALGSIFNYIRLSICAALRASGNTIVTLVTNIIANLVNIFFNYCFINGNLGFPELGVTGAAIATVIGNFAAFGICIIVLLLSKGFLQIRKGDSFRFDKKNAGTLIKVSTPALLEQLCMRFGFYIVALIVNNLGTDVVAQNAIISGIVSLSFNITDGFSIGAASLVGTSLGRDEKPLAFAYARLSQIVSFFLGLLTITTMLIFRVPVSRLFTNDTEVIEKAADILKIAVFVILPQSLQWVTTGALRGAGDVEYTAATSLLSVALIRPIFSFLLCYPLGLGLLGSWIGMFIDQSLRFYLNNRRLCSLKWMFKEV